MRVANKRRFIFSSSTVFIAIVIIVGGFTMLLRKNTSEILATDKTAGAEEYATLASGSDGNIDYEENEFFKKYVIHTEKIITKVDFEEKDNLITINLDKSQFVKLGKSATSEERKKEVFKIGKDSNVLGIRKTNKGDNFVYVDPRDSKDIIVLISKVENPLKYKVALDPGHGGEDKGVNEGTLYEKDIVLKIVKYMVSDLRFNGCQVTLTRDSDILNSLAQVADIVNKAEADVFLSVHINSFQDPKYSGVGTYYYDSDEGQKDERVKFATIIQKNAVKEDGWKDRGLFRDRLKVLRLSNSPCALVECGFLTNPDDKGRLQDDQVLKRLSNNLSNGIMEYLKAKK